MSLEDRVLSSLSFNGDPKQWEDFKSRFLAYATKRGYDELLTGEETVPITTYGKDGKKIPFDDPLKQRLIDLSKNAFADLTLVISTKTALGEQAATIVRSFKREKSDYPQGDVFGAWEALNRSYAQSGLAKAVDLIEKWDSFAMKSVDEHPMSVVARLEMLREEL